MHKSRRSLIKKSMGCAVLASGAAIAPSLSVAWPVEAFTEPDVSESAEKILGNELGTESDDIIIDAPGYIDEATIVEVTISTSIPEVDALAIFVRENPLPLAAFYELPNGTEPYVTTRLDIDISTDVIAVVRSKGKLFSNYRRVVISEKPEETLNVIDDDDDYWNQ